MTSGRWRNDGRTALPPAMVTVGGVRISNPGEAELLAAGYLPYVQPKPVELTPAEAAAAALAQAELEEQEARERPVTAAEFAALEKRVAALEKAAGGVGR